MGSRRGKGEGSVYKDAQGRWVAAVPLPPDPATGRRRRKVFRTRSKVEALRKMRETQNELARTGNVSTNRPVTVAEWMEQWIAQDVAPIRKPATTADYRSLTRTHIVPAIGRCRIDRLSSSDIRTLHRYISQSGRSSSTAAKVHRVLRAALAAAEREGVAPRNVARLVKAPPTLSQPPRAMSAEEARRFLRARRSRGDHARWSLALMLGERQGEALGLQLDHLHLDDAMPWVDLAWELRRVTWEHGCGIKALGAWPCGYRRRAIAPIGRRQSRRTWKQSKFTAVSGSCVPRPLAHSAASPCRRLWSIRSPNILGQLGQPGSSSSHSQESPSILAAITRTGRRR